MKKLLILLSMAVLSSCGMLGGGGGGSDTGMYLGYGESGKITQFSSSSIQIRQVDLINAIRAENGAAPVQLSAELTAAALTHSRDIANQNRAWNYGSDRSTPQIRGERAGYNGIVSGELVAETYLGENQVFKLWYSNSFSRGVITDPDATHVGIAYFMDSTGKVWWVTNFGQAGASQLR